MFLAKFAGASENQSKVSSSLSCVIEDIDLLIKKEGLESVKKNDQSLKDKGVVRMNKNLLFKVLLEV